MRAGHGFPVAQGITAQPVHGCSVSWLDGHFHMTMSEFYVRYETLYVCCTPRRSALFALIVRRRVARPAPQPISTVSLRRRRGRASAGGKSRRKSERAPAAKTARLCRRCALFFPLSCFPRQERRREGSRARAKPPRPRKRPQPGRGRRGARCAPRAHRSRARARRGSRKPQTAPRPHRGGHR